MTRYFLVAIACLAALGGIGYVVRAKVSERSVPIAAAAVAPAVPPPLDAAAERTGVLAVEGTVEKKRGDQWTALAAGDLLEEDAEIRTADDAEATIEVAGQQVRLHGRTQITMSEISEKVNIVLAEGHLSANGNDKTIRIEVRNSDAVAETANGDVDVITNGTGDVTVAANRGAVDVSAKGKRVRVGAGEQSSVRRGEAPSVPTKIPSSLFLKVSATGGGRQKVARLQGETAPGAIVSINGVRTTAAAEGVFELELPLKEGKNTLVVRVEDVRGRTETAQIRKDVDTRPPKLQTEVEWK
jgi:hypothetical protein